MNDTRYTLAAVAQCVYPASGATATLKRFNEDFVVTELPLQRPSGEGEHLWLEVREEQVPTPPSSRSSWPRAAGLRDVDVGHAGLKGPPRRHPQWVQHPSAGKVRRPT